jgi:competence protein ComEA
MKMNTRHKMGALICAVAMMLAACPAMAADDSGGAAAKLPSEGVINVNTATLQELMFLPGIGPSKAEAIVRSRANVPFKRLEQLTRIKGIGRKTLKNLQPWVRFDGATTVTGKLKAPAPAKTNP